jgi:hypothetical protein
MRYKLHSAADQDFVIDLDRNAFIPIDTANTDYQAYLAWLSSGNVPLPADEMAGNIVEQQSTQEN